MNYCVEVSVESGSLVSTGRAVITTPSGHHAKTIITRSIVPFTALIQARVKATQWMAAQR